LEMDVESRDKYDVPGIRGLKNGGHS